MTDAEIKLKCLELGVQRYNNYHDHYNFEKDKDVVHAASIYYEFVKGKTTA